MLQRGESTVSINPRVMKAWDPIETDGSKLKTAIFSFIPQALKYDMHLVSKGIMKDFFSRVMAKSWPHEAGKDSTLQVTHPSLGR